ncbi:12636_t:CDS:2, partial [Entrophospora sp. SA101]
LRLCHYGKYEYVDDSAKICIDEIHNLKEGGQVISSIKFSEYTSVRGICKFVKIIFKKDNDLMIIKRSENLQELYKLYLMKIPGNTITHDSTYNIHSDHIPRIYYYSNYFLITADNSLISQWDHDNLEYKQNYYIKSNDYVVFNNKKYANKPLIVVDYHQNSKIVVYSLEQNITVSSYEFKKNVNIKQIGFIYVSNHEDKFDMLEKGKVDKTDNKIIDKIIENNVKKLEPPLTPNNKPKENTLIILEGNKVKWNPGVLLLIPFVGFINYEIEESTDKLEEIEKKIKQIEESTDKHFQLLMEKLNKIKLL